MSSTTFNVAIEPYSYERLGFDDSIRLIKLLQGTPTDPLQCQIFTTRLAEKPEYEAVSYEWKLDTMGSSTINVASQSLGLPLNLRQGLMSFRLPDSSRVLWADSICINQNDYRERSQQVTLMRRIFAQADRVLVWLGDENLRTEDAFGLFRRLMCLWFLCRERALERQTINSREQLDILYQPKPRQGTSSLALMELDNPSEFASITGSAAFHLQDIALWKEADGLFQNSYFERVWIVQEIAVGKSILVHCGRRYQTWDIMTAAHRARMLLSALKRIPWISAEIHGLFIPVHAARDRYQSPSDELTLGEVLESFNFSKCSNPRDMIYAALGLIQQGCGSSIIPNYDKSTEGVFVEAATLMVRWSGNIHHLAHKASRNRKKLRDLPTWVPDWSSPAYLPPWILMPQNLANCIGGWPEIRGSVLYLDGHILDVVDFNAKVDTEEHLFCLMVRLAKKFFEMGGSLFGPYVSYKEHDVLIPIQQSVMDSDRSCHLRNLAEIFSFFCRRSDVPSEVLQTMQRIGKLQKHQYNRSTLNIEAIYLTLVPLPHLKIASRVRAGLPLFLSTLFLRAMLDVSPLDPYLTAIHSKAYSNWARLAEESLHSHECPSRETLEDVWSENMAEIIAFEDFFVTNNGYFGRAPPGHVEKEHVIAILDGGWTPYVLEKHGGYYEVVSVCYVEGLMDMQTLKPGMLIETLEIH